MQLLGHSIEKKNFTQHLSEITGLGAILGGPSLFANIGSRERMPSIWQFFWDDEHGKFFFRNPEATGTQPSDLYVSIKNKNFMHSAILW